MLPTRMRWLFRFTWPLGLLVVGAGFPWCAAGIGAGAICSPALFRGLTQCARNEGSCVGNLAEAATVGCGACVVDYFGSIPDCVTGTGGDCVGAFKDAVTGCAGASGGVSFPTECDQPWYGTEQENNCPMEWNGDSSAQCDCGCQFDDVDCPEGFRSKYDPTLDSGSGSGSLGDVTSTRPGSGSNNTGDPDDPGGSTTGDDPGSSDEGSSGADDDVPDTCATGVCEGAGGCVGAPDGMACSDDGDSCTTDVCLAAICTHLDGCGSDSCSGVPNGTTCDDDGDSCTSDVCLGGVCSHLDACSMGEDPGPSGDGSDDGSGAIEDPTLEGDPALDEGAGCGCTLGTRAASAAPLFGLVTMLGLLGAAMRRSRSR